MKKICVITGARSEYGLLSPLMRELKSSRGVKLQVIATGMHLSPKFGNTWRDITTDGFSIDAKVKFPLPDEKGTPTSIGRAVEGIAKKLDRLKSDMVILLGDRFETFAAAIAAYTLKIPIAHIHGGEITAGVFDEAFRHAITKMSSLHFTSTEEYRRRVVQLGERPDSVFNVGAIGLDNIKHGEYIERADLEAQLGIKLTNRLACVTFHPAMFEDMRPTAQLRELFKALDRFVQLQVVFTLPNADIGAEEIIREIKAYASKNMHRVSCFSSLGQKRYLSLLKLSMVVIGNSSSGIIEAPSLKVPTVNIGIRQEGRVRAASTIDCPIKAGDIELAIKKVLSPVFAAKLCKRNPYGDGNTAPAINQILLRKLAGGINVKKYFYDLNVTIKADIPHVQK